MFRLALPFTDADLLLAPRADEPPWFLQAGLLLLLCLGLSFRLYRHERRSAHSLMALGLLALRLAGLAGLCLAGGMLGPSAGWFTPHTFQLELCVGYLLLTAWLLCYDLLGGQPLAAIGRLTLRLAVLSVWVVTWKVPVLLLPMLCVASVGLTVWLYGHELRLVSRAAASSLFGLRLLVLVVLWFVLYLQPVVARSTSEELPGRVLIAVDRSDSMDITDPQRPAVEKLRLARALNLGGDLCTRAQLDDWIRQYGDKKDAPQWVGADEARDDPARRRGLEEERRRVHDQVCARVDQQSRSQLCQRLLSADGGQLLPAVAAKHQVELLGFAQEAWDVQPNQLDDLFQQLRGEPERAQDLTDRDTASKFLPRRAAAFTDLRLPLSRALEHSAGRGKILGVVVLTDGQHNWGPSPVAKALELGKQQIPVYPVGLGARQPPPDVALVSVKAPPAVFKDVDVGVEARFKVSGLPAQDVVVELQRPGQAPLQEHVAHDGSDRYYTVRFQTRLDAVGTQSLLVTARPANGGEIRTDNNSRPVTINVADDKAKVLLIDGEARWEFHYLASALERDRTMQLQTVVFDQPRLGKIAEDELQKAGNPRRTLPAEADALAAYDCIILGDVTPAQLPLADRVRLEKYVSDRGGTLVLLAGKRSLPLGFEDGARDAVETDPLLRLLPVEQPRAVHPSQGFPVTLTHEGKTTPFLQMDAAADRSEQRWADLPRHFWGCIGKAKPGAVPLAYVAEAVPGAAPAEPDAVEKERALIVRQNYGFGRVLYVGLDSTWRWRYKVGDLYHHRFWGQVVRWAASDKPLVTGNEYVRFGTREPVYGQGQQEVELVVRLGDDVGKPGEPPLRPDALAGARLLRLTDKGEEAVALVPLTAKEAQPRMLEGRIRDLPAGQYAVELAIPELADKLDGPPGSDGQPTKLRATFSVTPPDGEEMVELATKWSLLEELAAKSGGQVFTPEEAGQLVELLRRQSLTHVERIENRVWQWWVLLVLLLVLLTAEWAGRKWAGLP